MNNPKPDLAEVLQSFVEAQKQQTEVMQRMDLRLRTALSAPDREFVDRPGADAPQSRRASSPPPKKSLADQIYDLILKEPHTEPELSKLLGHPKSSINQAAGTLATQRRAVVIKTGRGKGEMNVVFHPGTTDPFGKLFAKMGWTRSS